MNFVKHDTVVSIRYIMKSSSGEVLEDNRDKTPVNYLHGSDAIIPFLQAQLEGLKAGDKKFIYLTKEDGGPDGDFTFEIIIDEVRDALKEELMLGYPVMLNKNICDDDCDCYK